MGCVACDGRLYIWWFDSYAQMYIYFCFEYIVPTCFVLMGMIVFRSVIRVSFLEDLFRYCLIVKCNVERTLGTLKKKCAFFLKNQKRFNQERQGKMHNFLGGWPLSVSRPNSRSDQRPLLYSLTHYICSRVSSKLISLAIFHCTSELHC